VTPTPNRINYPPQRAQYGPDTDQLLFTLLGKMDAVLDENRNLVNCVGELTHRVTVLEQGAYAPQAGRRRGPQRGRAIARAPSTRRSVLHHSPSSELIDPVLRGVEALDNTSETTTDTATGSEFSDDVDDCASSAGNDNEGPVVIDEGMLTKTERKAARVRSLLIFSFNSINTFRSYAFLRSSAKFATYLERNGPTLPKSASIPSQISSIPPRTSRTTF
jgi:hypothetical protein